MSKINKRLIIIQLSQLSAGLIWGIRLFEGGALSNKYGT